MPAVNLKPALAAILLGILFCGVSLGMVAGGRGIPAVFDGNETFSSILHARNLLSFDLGASVGLADESTSARPQAHPVVHTHQGNFPRLYATLLYALGMKSVTSQVLATVLPVGFASVLLLYAALYRFVGFGIACTAMLVMLTDYILFVQWQVVTYRVWHFAFTSALLAIAVFYRPDGRRWLLGALFATSLCLFYYELVFATFLSVAIAIFALTTWRKTISAALTFVAVQLAGAVAGVLVLIAQLVAYLGWDGFLIDLKLTYLSRNVGMLSPAHLAALRHFVEQHNIAFFYNFANPNVLHIGHLLLDSIFRWGLQVYTPPFAYCILILAAGVAIALFARPGRVWWPRSAIVAIAVMAGVAWLWGASTVVLYAVVAAAAAVIFAAPDSRVRPQNIGSLDAAMLCGTPAILFVLMAGGFSRFPGFERHAAPLWQYGPAFGIAVVALFAVLVLRVAPRQRARLTLDTALRGAALVCVAIALACFHAHLYDPLLTPLWQSELPGPFVPAFLQSAGMVLAMICAAALAAFGPALPDAVRAPLRATARRVVFLIGCFVVGLLVVLVLSPGYVYSGYMVRYLNMLVLPFALAIGLMAYAAAVIGRHLVATLHLKPRGRLSAVVTRLHLVPLALLAAWWIAVQGADARLFPPNELAVLKALEALAPARPTIVSNTYSGPFSVVTGRWAYLDETFSSGRTAFSLGAGYRYLFDRKYLWVADRDNPAYGRPDIFVCFIPPTYWSVAIRLVGVNRYTRCSENRVIELAERPYKAVWPRHTLVARDPSGRDTWAIVRLDWDFPPYLGAKPRVEGVAAGESVSLTVRYDYRQQDGKPERQTETEIRPISRNGATCTLRGAPLAAAKAVGGKAAFTLTPSDFGKDLVALVRPQSETRTGAPFFSAPFRVDQGTVVAMTPACGTIVDMEKKVWPQTGGG